ncbi:MAG: hypothetical protein HOH74_13600 [Gemmatimonadetes bacterium]|nr:hypothetical protein [Gemmatimonadota bacterium]
MTVILPVKIRGSVIAGDGRGRGIGYPTANVEAPIDALAGLQVGVYAAQACTADGENYTAVVNLGYQPTFAGKQLRLEAHLLDYSGDLYGTEVCVCLIRYLREERTFAGVEALATQIEFDIDAARSCVDIEEDSQSR